MWNKNRTNDNGRKQPHVISGHAGHKELKDTENGVDEQIVNTLDSWITPVLVNHDQQKKCRDTFQFLREMFQGRVDDDVVQMVLAECDWQEEKAIEQLFELSSETSDFSVHKSQSQPSLKSIARWLEDGKTQNKVIKVSRTEASNSFVEPARVQVTYSSACDSSVPLKYSEVASLEVDRSTSNCQLLNPGSTVNLRDSSFSNYQQHNSSPKVRTEQDLSGGLLLCDKSQTMSSSNGRSQVNQPRPGVFRDSDWSAADDVYYSDEETDVGVPAMQQGISQSLYSTVQPTLQFPPLNFANSGYVSSMSDPAISNYFAMTAPSQYSVVQSCPTSTGWSTQERSSYGHSFRNEDFVVPHVAVQTSTHLSPNEYGPARLPSPVRSPIAPQLWSTVPQNVFTPRSANSPARINPPPQNIRPPTQPQSRPKSDEATVLSAEEAMHRIAQRIQSLKVMVLLRGCPGSGKSTLARQIKFNGVIISADDFYQKNGKYEYDAAKVGDAHGWSKQQALNSIKRGVNPVIIDNTNTQAWEMLPYVEMACDFNYHVEVIEPHVPWRLKASQLTKNTIHNVPISKVQAMLSRYEHNITGKSLMETVQKKREAEASAKSAAVYQLQQPAIQSKEIREQQQDNNNSNQTKSAKKRRNKRKKKQPTVIGSDEDENENGSAVLGDKNLGQTDSMAAQEKYVSPVAEKSLLDTLDTIDLPVPIMCSANVSSEESPVWSSPVTSLRERGSDVEILEECEIEVQDSPTECQEKNDEVAFMDNPAELERAVLGWDIAADTDKSCILTETEDLLAKGTLSLNCTELSSFEFKRDIPKEPSLTESSYWSVQQCNEDIYLVQPALTIECPQPLVETSWLAGTLSNETADNLKTNTEPKEVDALQKGREDSPLGPIQKSDSKWQFPSLDSCPPGFSRRTADSPKPDAVDGLTQTEAEDLTAMYRLENSGPFDTSLFSHVLSARPREIFDRELAITSQSKLDREIRLVSKKNESTMTDDLHDGSIEEKMEFLCACFPTVSSDDLSYILSSCGNDTDLAVNVLLDSGYEYNEPSRHKTNANAAVVLPSEGESSDVKPSPSTPARNVKTRSFRQQRAPVSYTLRRDSIVPKIFPAHFEPYYKRVIEKRAAMATDSEISNPVDSQQNVKDEEKFVLALTPGFASQLVELFGPVDSDCMSDEDLNVEMSLDLAKLIYNSWKTTQRLKAVTRSCLQRDSHKKQTTQADYKSTSSEPTSRSLSPVNKLSQFVPNTQQPRVKSPDPEASSLSTKIKRQQLKERYPMINSTILDELFEATGYSYDVTVNVIAASPELIAPPMKVMTKKKAEEMERELIERAISESLKDHCSKKSSETKQRFTNCDEVYKDIISEACSYFSRYQDSLRQAQEAHRKKTPQVAMHYSQEANRYKEKVQEAKQLAAEMIMQSRISDLSSLGSLDLHGFSVRDALHLLRTSLAQREDELATNPDKRQRSVFVITGRGNHSHRGIARIKPAVEAHLKRNHYLYSESTPGVLKVRLNVGF